MIAFLLCIFLFSGYNLALILVEYHRADEVYMTAQQNFLDESEEDVAWPDFDADFAQLQAINPDVAAWIWIKDTVVNYPVLHGESNDSYIKTTYDGKHNSSGSIFMDTANAPDFSDTNTVIYGHNMKSGKMFAVLKKFCNQEFYNTHSEFFIFTPNDTRRYEIISAFQTNASGSVYVFQFPDAEAFNVWLDDILHNSCIETYTTSLENAYVTLSTCVSGKDASARFVVIGRLAEVR